MLQETQIEMFAVISIVLSALNFIVLVSITSGILRRINSVGEKQHYQKLTLDETYEKMQSLHKTHQTLVDIVRYMNQEFDDKLHREFTNLEEKLVVQQPTQEVNETKKEPSKREHSHMKDKAVVLAILQSKGKITQKQADAKKIARLPLCISYLRKDGYNIATIRKPNSFGTLKHYQLITD